MHASPRLPAKPSPMGHLLLHGSCSRFETLFNSPRASDAEAYLRQQYGGDAGFEWTFGPGMTVHQRGFEFSGLKVGTTHFGAPVSARARAIADNPGSEWIFLCNISPESHARYQALAAAPGEACAMRLKDFALAETTGDYRGLSITISDADLLSAHRALHGAPAGANLEFERKMAAGSVAAASVLRVIERLATTPRYPHQQAAQLERALKESALFELLLAWPGAQPAVSDRAILPASTRLARDYIHAHIAELPTITDVAAHCRVGVRALDRGFRKHLGASPWQYMLELRLHAVREDLLACRHGGTVTEVALHWGFSNLGTFAARYREQFGELPSESLRRARFNGSALRTVPATPAGQFRFETARSVVGS